MNAREIVAARNGKWCGSYGICACPVCQSEMRSDQVSLSVSDKGGRLLMKCHKSNCAYTDILRGLGVAGNKPPQISEKEEAERKAEIERRVIQGRVRALKVWHKAEPRRHLYLARKGFPQLKAATIHVDTLAKTMKIPKSLEHLGGMDLLLVIPMRNSASKLQSLEFITGEGEKCFLPGGKLSGSACWMGKEGPVVLCEGVGTGLSLRRSADSQNLAIRVACAGSATNMKTLRSVADFVMADNDTSDAGRKAALEVGKPFTMPPIVGMDFNDYESRLPSEAGLLLSRLLCDAPSLEVRQTK